MLHHQFSLSLKNAMYFRLIYGSEINMAPFSQRHWKMLPSMISLRELGEGGLKVKALKPATCRYGHKLNLLWSQPGMCVTCPVAPLQATCVAGAHLLIKDLQLPGQFSLMLRCQGAFQFRRHLWESGSE